MDTTTLVIAVAAIALVIALFKKFLKLALVILVLGALYWFLFT